MSEPKAKTFRAAITHHVLRFRTGVSLHRFLYALPLLWCLVAAAAEVIPPAPARYFNDYAHVTSSAVADQLNQQLENFERQTSDQILVVVFPKMESDSSIEDYTVRVAQAWKVGQKGKNNGAVLFVFVQDRKMFIQIGYGLEGALPDALANRIIENEIKPRFRTGDFDGGLKAGVAAMLSAVKGEYKGSGTTVAERAHRSGGLPPVIIILLVLILFGAFGLVPLIGTLAGTTYRRRRFGYWGPGWTIGSGGTGGWGSGGGGGWSGGGGGGGGFSGGGGSFGGGGAGGSW